MSKTKGKRFADKKASKHSIKLTEENNKKSEYSENNSHHSIHKKNNIIKNVLYNFVVLACIVAILFSSYNIVTWIIDNKNNKNLLDNLHNQVSVSEEQVTVGDKKIKKMYYDLSKLVTQNADTVGWLNVSNTNIDYPVVQTTDNDYYLNHSFDKSQNSAGWVFADYRCNFSPLAHNTVIYGHNRKDASMFGTLQRILNDEWYSNEDNLYIHFSTLNEDHVYRIFSTFVCNDEHVTAYTTTDFSNDEEFKSYLQKLVNCSSRNYETDISQTNQIITLYTCYGLNNQRLLVCASLVD